VKLFKPLKSELVAAIEESICLLKLRINRDENSIFALRKSIESDKKKIEMLQTLLKLQGSEDRVNALLKEKITV
jgi:hypothetical protein